MSTPIWRGVACALVAGCCAGAHARAGAAQQWPVAAPALLGEYEGATPCADCRAIELSVSFSVQNQFDTNSGTFTAIETYRGTADGDRSYTSGGRWTTMAGVDFDRAGWIGQLLFDERGRTLCVQRTGIDTLMLLERDCTQPTARATPVLRQKAGRGISQFLEVSNSRSDVSDAATFAVMRRTKISGAPVSVNEILTAERRDTAAPQFRLCLDVTDGGRRANVLTVVVRDGLDQFSLMLWEPARCPK